MEGRQRMTGQAAEDRLVYIVGTGMGGPGQMTGQAEACLKEAQVLMGAKRPLESARQVNPNALWVREYRPQVLAEWLKGRPWQRAALAVSGDTGFFSGAAGAREAFEKAGFQVRLIPGISALSWFAAAIGKDWRDMGVMSCHGRKGDAAAWAGSRRLSFFLLDGEEETSVGGLCRALCAAGLGDCRMWAGENLSYPDQRIEEGRCVELERICRERPFGPLSCAVVENPGVPEGSADRIRGGFPAKRDMRPAESDPQTHAGFLPWYGLEDSAFIRGKVPMTKAEIRAVALSKLRLTPGAVCYDVGSGTGSVAVEMGLALKGAGGGGSVYAVEQKPEAAALTAENARRHLGDWPGFHLTEGRAPQALRGLPAPTHVFIGGSGRAMGEVVGAVLEKNPMARIVANVITPESLGELMECRRRFAFKTWDMVQMTVASFEQVGPYHMPKGGNPTYIAAMEGPGGWEGTK